MQLGRLLRAVLLGVVIAIIGMIVWLLVPDKSVGVRAAPAISNNDGPPTSRSAAQLYSENNCRESGANRIDIAERFCLPKAS